MEVEYSRLGERKVGGGCRRKGGKDVSWISNLSTWRMGMSFLRWADCEKNRSEGKIIRSDLDLPGVRCFHYRKQPS